jgi:hypothetical protein
MILGRSAEAMRRRDFIKSIAVGTVARPLGARKRPNRDWPQ